MTPLLETCDGPEALEARRELAITEGWDALPFDEPERGIVGYELLKDGTRTRVGRFTEGRPLDPVDSVESDPEQIVALWKAHRGHDGFRMTSWPTKIQHGFICYCQADRGSSRVVRFGLTALHNVRAVDGGDELVGAITSLPL